MSDDLFDDDLFDFEDDPFGESAIPDTADELLEAWERDEAVIQATKGIINAEAELSRMEADAKALKEEADALYKEEAELTERLRKVEARRRAVDNKMHDGRRKWRTINDTKHELEARKRVAKENWERAQQHKESIKTLEARAQEFAWGQGVDVNGTQFKIMPHQLTGAVYIASYGRIILGDTMGTGKTLTSIAALDLVGAKKILIVTPADIANNFVREIKMWAPHRTVFSAKGLSKTERKTLIDVANMMGEYVCVINYEIWRRDRKFLKQLIDSQFDAVVMDEAHVMKTLKSDAYQGMRELIHANNACPECGALFNHELSTYKCDQCGWVAESSVLDKELGIDIRCSVKTVLPMTGSPILNSPEDLFTLLNLIDPNNFVSKHAFLNSYAEMGYDGKWTFREGGAQSLMKGLSGKFLARTMQDAGVILPEQKPILHEIDIDPEQYPLQYRTIQQLSKHATLMLDNGKSMSVMAAIALITRQRQANVWPGGIKITDPETGKVLLDVSEEVRESIKIDKAITMAEEFVANGERVAIFSQFKTGLAELEERLHGLGIKAVRFDGDTPQDLREEIKSNFDRKLGEESKWDIVLCNFKTGGVGLNLTACTQMIMLDREWNPGKEEQAFARINRMGQTERTFVHILELTKTIDQWHRKLIERKRDLIEGFNEEQQSLQEEYLNALRNGEML